MAGGMTPGGRETLAQRVANTRARQGGHGTQDAHGTRPASWSPLTPDTSAPASGPPPIKHCWYDGPYGRQAALLLEWRRIGDGYDGRIAVAASEPDGWAIVEMWVESGLLSAI